MPSARPACYGLVHATGRGGGAEQRDRFIVRHVHLFGVGRVERLAGFAFQLIELGLVRCVQRRRQRDALRFCDALQLGIRFFVVRHHALRKAFYIGAL